MTITLTNDLEELVNEEIKSGAYESADEVIRASLRLLKAREEGVDALRKEILLGFEAIQQGRFTSVDSDQELESFSDEIIRQAQERRDSRRDRDAQDQNR
jgi:putative addiction module CopG family antidote